MEMKKDSDCPRHCCDPRVSEYHGNIPKETMGEIEAISDESKKILHCGYCDSLWVEYKLSQNDYTSGNVWYQIIRIKDVGTLKEKWFL